MNRYRIELWHPNAETPLEWSAWSEGFAVETAETLATRHPESEVILYDGDRIHSCYGNGKLTQES